METDRSLQTESISNDLNEFWNILINQSEPIDGIKLKGVNFFSIFAEQADFDYYITYVERWFEIWLYKYLSSVVSNSTFEKQQTDYFEKFGNDFFKNMTNYITHNTPDTINKDKSFFSMVSTFRDILQVVVQKVQVSTGYLDMHKKVADVKDDVETKTANLTFEIKKIKTKLKATKKRSRTISKHIKQAEESLADTSKKNAEFSITILGIFVAIIMVFFGDITIISKTAETNVPMVLLLTCVLYNSVILLFFLIGKFTDKSLCCKCMLNADCKNCLLCTRRISLKELCLLRNRYPYVYWVNLFFIFCFIFIQCKQFLTDMQFDKDYQIGYSFIFVCIVAIIMFVIELLIASISKKLKQDKENKDTKQNNT